MNMEKIQKFGRALSNMVQPNIGAFIAWGFITALFIPTGWLPNENFVKLVGPMIKYLLPLLIAHSGGHMIYGHRGAVVGTVMTMGVIIGTSIPMFLGAMIAGPLGAFLIKKFDQSIHKHIPTGFEMLINNFSAGILGLILALISFQIIGPGVEIISKALSAGVDIIVKLKLLPLVSIIVEPAKVFFLNNAINHGVFTPLGTQQIAEFGKSIFFTIETNPGPGLGVLLAYMIFGKGRSKSTAPGATIIHFLGGIHEIYFPYVLMKPILILALIVGGISGVLTTVLLSGGLVAPPSPGSIIAILAVTPKGGFLATLSSVTISTIVTFFLSSFFIKRDPEESEEELESAIESSKSNKELSANFSNVNQDKSTNLQEITGVIKKIAVACDAGMGSSAFGATSLRKIVKEQGLEGIEIINSAISNLTDDIDLIITQKTFSTLVNNKMPGKPVLFINNFMDKEFYKSVVEKIKANNK